MLRKTPGLAGLGLRRRTAGDFERLKGGDDMVRRWRVSGGGVGEADSGGGWEIVIRIMKEEREKVYGAQVNIWFLCILVAVSGRRKMI
ncbi:hypothetical protein HAX54_016280 [Datura stramonium]|uniref:Uncharacterized protein n=1 Tax=Datura stramonium TaxID=4076 RepID=A0ABS8RZW1_DATST|nr:hypothetical protein [Datura stramonium]